ncbi:MAG TPA: hypothetical protein VGK78_03295 [Nocardioides sp.]|uniref:hypothetical protein n=1 Tax=Nocardioides sp. TaxID=35761 RepID=UPI002F42EFF7
MADEGFGSSLWKNVEAIKLGQDGGIEAPVRADDRDGIVVGLGHLAEADARRSTAPTPPPRRRWWVRLLRRRA